MGNVTQARSRGFTLVEMSIVLVIIGLIIGGILKGQEIIASARQKAVINQINAVKAASNTYFDRYRALPGDDPAAAANLDVNLTSGDGNGIVGTAVTSTAGIVGAQTGNAGENYQFFDGLIAANLLNGGEVTANNGAAKFGSSALPAAPVSGAGVTVVYGTHNGDNGADATIKTAVWLRLHKGVKTPVAAISPRTAANIDSQIDDGNASDGGVRGDDVGCNAAGAVNAPAAYTASDNLTCLQVYEISQ